MQVSGRTTRSESSRFACSMARMMLAVLVSKSPLVVLIWPIVTRMVVLREIVPDPRPACNPRPFCLASQHALYSCAPHAEGSHNGSAAVLKTAGRKAMQVRVLSPPPTFLVLVHEEVSLEPLICRSGNLMVPIAPGN